MEALCDCGASGCRYPWHNWRFFVYDGACVACMVPACVFSGWRLAGPLWRACRHALPHLDAPCGNKLVTHVHMPHFLFVVLLRFPHLGARSTSGGKSSCLLLSCTALDLMVLHVCFFCRCLLRSLPVAVPSRVQGCDHQ